jgi:beta-glucosidase
VSPTGFIANRPEGFWQALVWARRFRLPILIAENGIEDQSDGIRPRYLASHLRQLWRAVNFNWNVRGYLHWTLVDNFEWERGWTQRFGCGVDPSTWSAAGGRARPVAPDLQPTDCRPHGGNVRAGSLR